VHDPIAEFISSQAAPEERPSLSARRIAFSGWPVNR